MDKVYIVYWSQTGNTQAMAEAIAKGVTDAGKEAVLKFVTEASLDELKQAKAFALGCPAMGAEVLEEMDMENAELATLYYGEGVTEDDANQLLAYLEEHYPDVEFELYLGAQAVYSYLISVE